MSWSFLLKYRIIKIQPPFVFIAWDNFYGMIYVKPLTDDDGQMLLEFASPEYVLYTNLEQANEVSKRLCALTDCVKSI